MTLVYIGVKSHRPTMPKTPRKQAQNRLGSGKLSTVSTLQDRLRLAMRARGFVPGKKKGMNALARTLGRSQGFVSGQLGRTKDPRASTLVLFAERLRVRLDWLLRDVGPMDLDVEPETEPYASLAGWAEEAPRVRGVPTYAVDAVGRRPIAVRPERVTVDFIRALAGFWLSWAPEAEEEGRRWIDAQRRTEGDAPPE